MPSRRPTPPKPEDAEPVLAKLIGIQPRIEKLLEGATQVNPPMDPETRRELSESIDARGGKLLDGLEVFVSARGKLFEGITRLEILLERGRKTLTLDEIRYRPDITTKQDEAVEATHIQNARRPTTAAVKAHQARYMMAEFGWSQGRCAKELRMQPSNLSRALKDYPDPDFVAPTQRLGLDDRVIDVSPMDEPKAKAIRTPPKSGHVVMSTTDNYHRNITNPELLVWVVSNADRDDFEPLSLKWEQIAKAAQAISDRLEAAPEGPEEAF